MRPIISRVLKLLSEMIGTAELMMGEIFASWGNMGTQLWRGPMCVADPVIGTL